MVRILKLCLLTALLLSLPLRAVAGMAMPSCAMHPAGMPLAAAGAADGGHCAHGAEDETAASAAGLGADCTLYGDCCVAGAALPMLAMAMPLVPSGDGPLFLPPVPHAGFEPDGPERPPRSTSL